MVRQAKCMAAAVTLIGFLGIAACSGEQGEASVVPEAYAASPVSQPDYGWRPSEGASKLHDDTAYDYQ